MAISWKKNQKLKPSIILERVNASKLSSGDGRVSFSIFPLQEALPALDSMLEFPAATDGIPKSLLIWKAITGIDGEITPDTFIKSINKALVAELATEEQEFHILTDISIAYESTPTKLRIEGCTIEKVDTDYPHKYSERELLIKRNNIPVPRSPYGYTKLLIKVRAKSPQIAMTKALKSLDLVRSIWSLLGNSYMEIIGDQWQPINKIRLGSIHTIHNSKGHSAIESVWYEPNFTPASIFKFDNTEIAWKKTKEAISAIKKCKYSEIIIDTLIRYVRALDERDQSTAFLRLWSATESITSNGSAHYDSLIARCAFLYKDHKYHEQILEHLREFRNKSVHAGDQSENTKSYCYQLQEYFKSLVWFHIRNVKFFNSLAEANSFLDMGHNKKQLLRKRRIIGKAIRFIS
ncbi:HEPN domain-containing protein [Mesoterricola silvestris]|uniref:Apea-like HEPN domain-containing protein n=1 Tax=Mesoterricola silvestris TaxID=2927979 RepID=A0AA48KBP9_9BACT|nr:HEPN domain-containing protein [Mesoterricola silvestris]BDU74542.1 hypothetical protein METEAL_37160 [Mesoterricola silvestris]